MKGLISVFPTRMYLISQQIAKGCLAINIPSDKDNDSVLVQCMKKAGRHSTKRKNLRADPASPTFMPPA